MGDRGSAQRSQHRPPAAGSIRRPRLPGTHGTTAAIPTRDSTRPEYPRAAERPVAQPPGTPQRATGGCPHRKPRAWCRGLRLCLGAPALHSAAEAKGILGVPASALPKIRAGTPGRGAPTGTRASPTAPTTPPAAEAAGHCGTWLPQLPLLAVPWSEPQPGGYFWLCITFQLTPPPRCHSPAMHPPLTRPSSHAHACAPRPGRQRSPSLRIKVAGGDARCPRCWRPSRGVATCQPRAAAQAPWAKATSLRPRPQPHVSTKPQSAWHRVTVKFVPAPAPACPWVAPAAAAPRASLSPSARSALSTATARLTRRAAPVTAGVAWGVSAPHGGRGCGCRPSAGRRLLQCRGLALPTLRARAAARSPEPARSPSPAAPCPHAGRDTPALLSPASGRRARARGAQRGCGASGQRCSSIRAGCLHPSRSSPGPGKGERDELGPPAGARQAPRSPHSLCLCCNTAIKRANPGVAASGCTVGWGCPHPELRGPWQGAGCQRQPRRGCVRAAGCSASGSFGCPGPSTSAAGDGDCSAGPGGAAEHPGEGPPAAESPLPWRDGGQGTARRGLELRASWCPCPHPCPHPAQRQKVLQRQRILGEGIQGRGKPCWQLESEQTGRSPTPIPSTNRRNARHFPCANPSCNRSIPTRSRSPAPLVPPEPRALGALVCRSA